MLLYFSARFIRWISGELFPLFSGYFTDVLFVPTMCSFALIFTRIFKKDTSIQMEWYWIGIITMGISFYFEYYLPFQPGNTYVSDPFDVVCYFVGAGIFLIIQKKEPKKLVE